MTWTPVDLNDYPNRYYKDTWNPGAIDCYQSDKDCRSCQNSQATDGRLRADAYDLDRCQMPGVVQRLLNKGREPEPVVKDPQRAGKAMTHMRGIGLIGKRKKMAELRAAICEALSTSGALAGSQICAKLNEMGLQNYRNWHIENLRGTLAKMVEFGVIRMLDHKVKVYGYQFAYELIDASKVEQIVSWQQQTQQNGRGIKISPSRSEFSQGRKAK